MNSWVYRESFTMLLMGIWLLLQCYHVMVREERKLHIGCVVGKLLVTGILLVIHPVPILAIILFLAFYPKFEPDGIRCSMLGIQVVLSVAGAVLCGFLSSGGLVLSRVGLVMVLAFLFAMTDFGVRSILLKNKQLYRQMESTALNEQKVKNLNREISLRSQMAERNARLEERENIARNIHNVVGHTITSALVSLQAYEVLKEADPERAEGKLSATSDRMHLALEEIRRAVRVLDAETEDISLQDFCSLLATEADKFSMDTEIKIVHNFAEGYEKELRVEKRTCEFLHSVLTECLNNGIRHGGATQFFVHLTYDTAHIKLVVSDNGQGLEGLVEAERKRCLENGYGLRKMKDYVQTHAGAFKVDGDNGFKVQVELPLVAGAEDKGEK